MFILLYESRLRPRTPVATQLCQRSAPRRAGPRMARARTGQLMKVQPFFLRRATYKYARHGTHDLSTPHTCIGSFCRGLEHACGAEMKGKLKEHLLAPSQIFLRTSVCCMIAAICRFSPSSQPNKTQTWGSLLGKHLTSSSAVSLSRLAVRHT